MRNHHDITALKQTIAREYGLPCITGITNATEIRITGDSLTVDVYLGIVIIDTTTRSNSR